MIDISNFNEHATEPLNIGKIDINKVYSLVGIQFTDADIYIYPGAIKHIKKEHPTIWESYGHELPAFISNPDYIGKNPSHLNSIELYKYVGDNLLLAIKLDPSGYLFVSSFYKLDNAYHKINKRLASGRIVPFK